MLRVNAAPNGQPRPVVTCGVPEDNSCPREAVEVLLAWLAGERDLHALGCCDLHPAADAAREMLLSSDGTRQYLYLVVPLPAADKDGA